ncbi:MAG: asparagine synthetase B family protein [Verrucomicrobiae bacterium]|nr:asparagine synthetase B family protein [Verrucomicrobiae bacterium]
MNVPVERVVDLLDPALNRLPSGFLEEARERVRSGDPAAVRTIPGSFALWAREGKKVRMARSLDRPMRYFLAKRHEGPALIVADRIDALYAWLKSEGLEGQFHPSYTRMVPAHYVVEIELVGCPDPDPVYRRFLDPERNSLSGQPDEIGAMYVSALSGEILKWLPTIPEDEPVGVCFSGGIDSGAVFILAYQAMRQLAMNPSRLKAFTLDLGGGADLAQARRFLESLGLALFHEPVEADPATLDPGEAVRIVEDYKPLDIEAATMLIALLKGIRARYPKWRHLADGDGGDENLKDYPIEENPELTIRSVVNNLMLYQEGWGVGKIKHSLTYSGGLSRSYTRTYAPMRHFGFAGFSPFTQPHVVEIAEGIPFAVLTGYDHQRLYELKGDIVRRGMKQVLGIDFPVFPKRRFQHGVLPLEELRRRVPDRERFYRRQFAEQYGEADR